MLQAHNAMTGVVPTASKICLKSHASGMQDKQRSAGGVLNGVDAHVEAWAGRGSSHHATLNSLCNDQGNPGYTRTVLTLLREGGLHRHDTPWNFV